MNHLKNKNIKYLILPMIILTILTSIVITIQTYNQYKKVTVTANQKIAEIIGTIIKEDLKHIFERFYKGKNSSENSVGIGLALAKNIIEKNNGMISCKSELDKGTEFVIKYMK